MEVSRFWNYFSTNPRLQPIYFSHTVGRGVVNCLRLMEVLKGNVLDYGCGPGYLLGRLLESGAAIDCWGVDSSPASVAECNARLTGQPGWKGAQVVESLPSAFEDESFDLITCLETLEHLTDVFLFPLLGEIRRLLRPGGFVLFTVPADEDLEANLHFCPFCDSEFHHMQHVRSFSAQSLTELLRSADLEVVFCQPLNLYEFQRQYAEWRSVRGPRGLRRYLGDVLGRWHDRLNARPWLQGREFQRHAAIRGAHLAALVRSRR